MTAASSVVTKADFDIYIHFSGLTEEEAIRHAVDSLISHLYRPHPEVCWRADGAKLRRLGMANEAINWGDLSCVGVERFADGSFLVTVEEASPEAVSLSRYLRGWLEKWGWQARVQTEW